MEKCQWRKSYKGKDGGRTSNSCSLNIPVPIERPGILPAKEDLEIECGCPIKEEINKAIRQQSGKAAGPDNIPAEAFQADRVSADILHPFLGHLWETCT